jgi:hypothetical protein
MLVLCLFSLSDDTAAPSPAVCYYILLPCQHSAAQQVIICLLATTETNLEVFQSELTQFCEMLATHIPSTKVVNQTFIIKPCMPFTNKKYANSKTLFFVAFFMAIAGHCVSSSYYLSFSACYIEVLQN